ncbi:hypothetical protein AAEO56_09465 [Flavobacterium sp. DGU11]|uniref:HTH cro/C1-type domain-containing protein n=1 Tax=Flavobacterium arundinis TaxID=3139143 RepID=A0ABU9HWE4_9FLAO
MEEITYDNISNFIKRFMKNNNLEIKTIAKEINCSISTLNRIIKKESLPTSNMLKQVGIMISIGFEKYRKLSNSEKESISEKIGAFGGGILGFGSITAAIGASGTVAGLSAAGITSGLSAIGGIVGGGMTVGIITVAFIPIATIGVGFGIIKGVKSIISNNRLNNVEYDSYWEYPNPN